MFNKIDNITKSREAIVQTIIKLDMEIVQIQRRKRAKPHELFA